MPADLPACVAVLRRVHEASGYPSLWPDDPSRWIIPRDMVAAWVAEHDGSIAGHVALVRGMRLECLLRATGRAPDQLGGIARLYVDPAFRRLGLARALLDAAADGAVARSRYSTSYPTPARQSPCTNRSAGTWSAPRPRPG